MNVSQPAEIARLRNEIPVEFYAFDLLELNGVSLLGKKYDDRRSCSTAWPSTAQLLPRPRCCPGLRTRRSRTPATGQLEGIVAKRRDSVYRPGKRSRTWLKIKNFHDLEVVIGGWKPGNGSRAGSLGLAAGRRPGRRAACATPARSAPGSTRPPWTT